MRRNGFDVERQPILRPLDTIECRDAVLNPDGTEAEWPHADCIVGNPPFLGGSKILSGLGGEYTEKLRTLYIGRMPGGADLVTYWFEKARAAIEQGEVKRVGLVSTQAIRAGSNRTVLERIKESGEIFEAWSDEQWVVNGADMRVSLTCFSSKEESLRLPIQLNAKPVQGINADLSEASGSLINLLQAIPLAQNLGVAFKGDEKNGQFDISADLAREWLSMPLNVNSRPNADIFKPWYNALDVTRGSRNAWIIDFKMMPLEDASFYEKPFAYVLEHVKPERDKKRDEYRRKNWWRHGRPVPDLKEAIGKISRYIVTPRVAKHRLFVWVDSTVVPDSRLYAIARGDDATFGILHSRFHQAWSLATCSWHGDGEEGGRPTHNAHSCFETFPFPQGLTPNIPAAEYADDPRAEKISIAAKRLDQLRNNWLNPPDLIMSVPEVVKGYPDRILPKDEAAAQVLKQRTLTNLYNEQPAWLHNAHRELDKTVADAYGWQPDMSDDEMLTKLLALNLERAKEHPRQ
jgi:type II restriction/modification system DNA methylase subunit YeeA